MLLVEVALVDRLSLRSGGEARDPEQGGSKNGFHR